MTPTIGIDFDNTLVCYDRLFEQAAVDRGLIPSAGWLSKGALRDHLRATNRVQQWKELQGYVYGVAIQEAAPFAGALEFLYDCRKRKIPVRIISHKQQTPFEGPAYNLHHAALQWLEHQGFFKETETGLSVDQVFFEPTPAAKMARVALCECRLMIDDLPEFLLELPAGPDRILFDPTGERPSTFPFPHAGSWKEIQELAPARLGL